ncbi:MAG: hypothetical protein H0X26_03470 [Alphaproteobacteria bacterium]|nr:hypothetical protein [Alphaproteobacteria bacterium]
MRRTINKKFVFKMIFFSLFMFQVTDLYADQSCNNIKNLSGPYTLTNCKECGYEDNILSATCPESDKRTWHFSTLDTKEKWKPYTNKDGVLTGADTPSDASIYSFNSSCQDITYTNNNETLKVKCRKKDGVTWQDNTLDLSTCDHTAYIDNQDGTLTCKKVAKK